MVEPQYSLNRREFSKASAFAAVAASSAATSSLIGASKLEEGKSEEDKTTGYIDAHVHVWTPELQQYPLHESSKRKICSRRVSLRSSFSHIAIQVRWSGLFSSK